MKRIIKFRAWEIKGKGWIQGFNMVNYHGYYNKGLKPNIFRYSTEWEEEEYILEQFTGITDKEGQEIYEGDILNWEGLYLEVKYSDHHACFMVGTDMLDKSYGLYSVVAGNIHTKKELID